MNDEPQESVEQDEAEDFPRCGANRTDGSGEKCRNGAGKNTEHYGYGQCSKHGGNTPSGVKHAAHLQFVAESSLFGRPDTTMDPQSALLGEIHRTAGMVHYLDTFLQGDPDNESARAKHERERLHLARACKMALDAGIDERMVRIAEMQMKIAADLLRKVLADPELDLSAEQKSKVPGIARRHLKTVA